MTLDDPELFDILVLFHTLLYIYLIWWVTFYVDLVPLSSDNKIKKIAAVVAAAAAYSKIRSLPRKFE